MAVCTGCGFDTEDGRLTLKGPRSDEWPYAPDSTLDGSSGLKCDPVTGKLWTPPDMKVVHSTITKPNRTVVPATDDDVLLHETSLTITAATRSESLLRFDVNGGYAGFRVGTGNWWAVKRYITTYYDGVPSTYTTSEYVASIENHSGDVMGIGTAVDAQMGWDVVPAGTVVKVLARYELEILLLTDSEANTFTWRCPRISLMAASVPQQ